MVFKNKMGDYISHFLLLRRAMGDSFRTFFVKDLEAILAFISELNMD